MSFTPTARSIIEQITDSGDVVLTEQIGAANGVAGLDADGNIVATPIHRVDTAANLSAIVLKTGEIAITSDTQDILRGDGVTAGGVLVRGNRRFTGSGEVSVVFGSGETVPSTSVTIPVVPGASYDISGVFGFSGDTDSQSNCIVRTGCTGATLDTSLNSYTRTLVLESMWFYGTGVVTPDLRIVTTSSLPQFGIFALAPVALDKSAAYCKLQTRINVSTSNNGNYGFYFWLRTAKLGSPTIMAGYDLSVVRVK